MKAHHPRFDDQHTDCRYLGHRDGELGIPDSEVTIAVALEGASYATGIFGKWAWAAWALPVMRRGKLRKSVGQPAEQARISTIFGVYIPT